LLGEEFTHVEFRLPELSITGDNAIMIAQAALARRLSGAKGMDNTEIRAVGNLSLAG
jgi:tRNA A37 threonylcarbamoyltransferase TsaD